MYLLPLWPRSFLAGLLDILQINNFIRYGQADSEFFKFHIRYSYHLLNTLAPVSTTFFILQAH